MNCGATALAALVAKECSYSRPVPMRGELENFLAARTDSCIFSVEFGAWLSPVERLLREQEAPGSNPGAPTTF